MMRTRTAGASLAMACCAALSLTACGGNDDTAEPGGTASSVSPTTSEAEPENSGVGDGSAEALCDYLSGEVADLKAIGSEVGAMANLTVNLFSWYDEQGAVPSGTEIDEQTQQECPDVRTEVLKIAGIESFAAL